MHQALHNLMTTGVIGLGSGLFSILASFFRPFPLLALGLFPLGMRFIFRYMLPTSYQGGAACRNSQTLGEYYLALFLVLSRQEYP
jgi:hypothetical protein